MKKLNLDEFLRKLEKVTALEEIHGLTLGLRDHYKIDHVVYHWVSADGDQYGFGTYPPKWVQHYVDKEYLRIDPVVIGCFQGAHPVNWKRLDWRSKAARQFQLDAIDHGIGNQGYSIPLRGPNGQFAVFSVSHTCSDDVWEAFTAEHQRDLVLIAYFLNQKALELEKNRVPEATRPLSPREVDALTFLAMGYGRAQVADMLSISEHTLRAYIESARFKLGASNTIHAVAKALADGHIIVGGAARDSVGGWPGRDTHSGH
ncbi:MAG: LuxR family transcriptional regulator [Yoonia sp.]|uniref:helix-turn-helix transcriptional regulator n=1 Tax=Yoonia sp. TaxID=2212373 RepID=UPI0021FE19B2|nr:LuxR family transcriptional regulator [Rhodobacteraceae bacterium S2214]